MFMISDASAIYTCFDVCVHVLFLFSFISLRDRLHNARDNQLGSVLSKTLPQVKLSTPTIDEQAMY